MKRSSSLSSSSSTSSSANPKKPSAAPKGAALARRKKPANARVPLHGLNGAVPCGNGYSDTSLPSSASTSIEAPKGCLRFFLSISSSSAKAKTPCSSRSGVVPGSPSSAPDLKPQKKLNPDNCNGNPRTCPVSSNVGSDSMKENKGPVLTELDICNESSTNRTPVSKIHGGSGIGLGLHGRADENSNGPEGKTKTPPIEASVSPEIQCGSLNVYSAVKMASGTQLLQPCYGAGHVLSGVTDKRKCKPRGILTMADNNTDFKLCYSSFENAGAAADDDDGADGGAPVGRTSGLSPVPLPCEASMHWLSPCHEEGENDQKGKSPVQRLQELASASISSSPLLSSGTGFSSSDMYSKSSLSSGGTSRRGSSPPARPVRGLHDFHGFYAPVFELPSPSHMTPIFSSPTMKERRKCSPYDEQKENLFSGGSFGSGNVIQTPHSNSASKIPRADSEVDLMAGAFDKMIFSREEFDHHLPTWDTAELSFQLDYLTTPCNSIDLAQVQKIMDCKAASRVSNCTSDFVQSQNSLRISWRDGLASRIFEMDEYDCCRCFSDEEEEHPNSKLDHSPQQISGMENNKRPGGEQLLGMDLDIQRLNSHPNQIGGIKGSKDPGTEQLLGMDLQVQSMSLDSLSSEGGRLIASDDSGWNLCYKNRLFEV
ncbi:hypothetical protein SAY87_014144 [Trapa incisa]|uniref:Uncharacterized protein n=1 Tax=Trapa incisa TaxID=236973 RepID=A0AAN7GV55_9MYRT|nr:hypothetical protein SAY87_014144 [Trapa incisa]